MTEGVTSADVTEAEPDARLVALLDRLGGAGEGRDLLRLLREGEAPALLARRIASSAACERLYKEARTVDIGADGARAAAPAFVGLPDLPVGLPFAQQFERFFRPRLGRRADGFAAIFEALGGAGRELLVIETGCMRIPGNWDGDGQSTFLFDALARDCGGVVVSVDVTPESLDTARRACSLATQLILGDSVAVLHALARLAPRPASLLYLDSYDLDVANPLPSAIHHALELMAAGPLLGPGTLVCVDDYGIGADGGKGMIVDRFFANVAAPVVYSGYQKVWRVP
jgi:hypothetical protein